MLSYYQRNREQELKRSKKRYEENKEEILRKKREKHRREKKILDKVKKQEQQEKKQKLYNRGYKDGIFQTALFSGIVLVSVVAIWISSNHLLNQKLEDSEKRAEKRIEYWIEQYENKGVK